MKTINSTLLVALFSTTALGQQPNPRLQQLEEFLQTQDIRLDHRQYSHEGGITHSISDARQMSSYWKSYFRGELSDEERQQRVLTVNSRIAQKREAMQRLTGYFRTTFTSLSGDAAESYLYEYHKEGTDTVKYSYMSSTREVASFDFDSTPHTGNDNGIADYSDYSFSYHHSYVEPSDIEGNAMRPFDAEAFCKHIEPVLKKFMRLKGAKAVPALWQHDENFEKAEDFFPVPRYGRTRHEIETHPGLTTGTHYIIPSEHEATASVLYRQLDSLAYDYLCRHPEQPYGYTFTTEMVASDESHYYEGLPRIVEGRSFEGSDEFHLCCKREQDGRYHIFTLRNKGVFWIPREFASLRSYVNGEKTYLEGMEQKEGGTR